MYIAGVSVGALACKPPVSLRVDAFAGLKTSRRASCIVVLGGRGLPLVSNGWHGMTTAHVSHIYQAHGAAAGADADQTGELQ